MPLEGFIDFLSEVKDFSILITMGKKNSLFAEARSLIDNVAFGLLIHNKHLVFRRFQTLFDRFIETNILFNLFFGPVRYLFIMSEVINEIETCLSYIPSILKKVINFRLIIDTILISHHRVLVYIISNLMFQNWSLISWTWSQDTFVFFIFLLLFLLFWPYIEFSYDSLSSPIYTMYFLSCLVSNYSLICPLLSSFPILLFPHLSLKFLCKVIFCDRWSYLLLQVFKHVQLHFKSGVYSYFVV